MKASNWFLWFFSLSIAFAVWSVMQLWPWFSLGAALFLGALVAYFAGNAQPPPEDEQ